MNHRKDILKPSQRDPLPFYIYIRRMWGGGTEAVSASTVVKIRYRTQGKVTPWTAEELLQDITIPD